jgi:L-amino acid N-acyltransferase YncA
VTQPTGSVVRSATHEDAATIAHIYNQGIEDRIATFQTGPRTVADVERRLLSERATIQPSWSSATARWWRGPVQRM